MIRIVVVLPKRKAPFDPERRKDAAAVAPLTVDPVDTP